MYGVLSHTEMWDNGPCPLRSMAILKLILFKITDEAFAILREIRCALSFLGILFLELICSRTQQILRIISRSSTFLLYVYSHIDAIFVDFRSK